MATLHYSASGTIFVIREGHPNDVNTIRAFTLYLNSINQGYSLDLCVNQEIVATPADLVDLITAVLQASTANSNIVVSVVDNLNETWSVSVAFDNDGTDNALLPTLMVSTPRDTVTLEVNFAQDAQIGFTATADPCPECPEVPEPIPGCKECFAASIAECNDITLDLGLTPDEVYTWDILYLALNLRFQGTATADSAGKIVINQVDLPTGLLSPYSGSFKLQLLDDEGAPLSFSIGGTIYSCINLSVHAGDGSAIIPNPGASASVFNGDDEPFLQVD